MTLVRATLSPLLSSRRSSLYLTWLRAAARCCADDKVATCSAGLFLPPAPAAYTRSPTRGRGRAAPQTDLRR